MSVQFYFKNVIVTSFLAAFIYWKTWGVEVQSKNIFLVLVALTALLYPFSKYLMGEAVSRIAGKDFWDKLVSGDGPARTYGVGFCFMLCLIFSMPLGFLCVLWEIKKAAKKFYIDG